MSAYLNTGMVSPMRIAREANAAPGAGKAKFLNEFLTWRGLSYAWCYHIAQMEHGRCTLSSLPSWARATLLQHASDPRVLKTAEQLRDGRTGDKGWDGMQAYLVRTGELHNNARMGWGCAVVKWTRDPQAAMETLLMLNDTFALDGHSACTHGGLLGCLGLFSGPKGNAAITGSVGVRAVKSKYAALAHKAREFTTLESFMRTKSRVVQNGGAAPLQESNMDMAGEPAASAEESGSSPSKKQRRESTVSAVKTADDDDPFDCLPDHVLLSALETFEATPTATSGVPWRPSPQQTLP